MQIDLRSWRDRFASALSEQHRILIDPDTGGLRAEYAQYTDCPVCDSPDSNVLFVKDGFRHVRCRHCSMVYLNPRFNDSATAEFYNSRVNEIYNETKFDTVSDSTQLDDEANLFNLLEIERYRNTAVKGKILEIGSGGGYFLRNAKDLGYQVYGLELNKRNYQLTRAQLGDTIYNLDLLEAQFVPEMFDVIYMRDVIEHVPRPQPFFRELHRIAKKGSVLFLETHNIDSFINRITRERHTVIFGFEHPNHWSPRTIDTILTRNGFRIVDVRHVSLDFTVQGIIRYLLHPSFTTVFPREIGRTRTLVLKMIRKPFTMWPLCHLDNQFLPRVANLCRHGSVIKVLTTKATV